jgi:hypothetical protein
MVQQADGPSGQTLELFISPNNLSQQQMKYGVFKVQKKKTLHYFKKLRTRDIIEKQVEQGKVSMYVAQAENY